MTEDSDSDTESNPDDLEETKVLDSYNELEETSEYEDNSESVQRMSMVFSYLLYIRPYSSSDEYLGFK